MLGPTHEQTINSALGEVLHGLRSSWTVRTEHTGGVFEGGGRPDILIEDASGWPVVIEADRSNHEGAEHDALVRIARKVASTGLTVETAIALVYPEELSHIDGAELRNAVSEFATLEYALYTRQRVGGPAERLPQEGWLSSDIRDLAMFVHRAAAPAPRVEELADAYQRGVEQAADALTRRHTYGNEIVKRIAETLGQEDELSGQTRRMAMTVLTNALVYQEALAQAEFPVPQMAAEGSGLPLRGVRSPAFFRNNGVFAPDELADEWSRILEVNYWPIFWTAREILKQLPMETANAVLRALWGAARGLIDRGVTRSHDLTGILFQKLIADRKFLATYYTRPEAAALLAGLALPAGRAPGGADWGDGETLASLQIGDFACGTGTLLSAAYQRLSLLHELHGGDPRKLHAPMMKNGLVGLDVVNIAVHLTAAMLAGSHPDTPFDGECLLTMPYGDLYMRPTTNGKGKNGRPKEAVTVGSLDLLAETVQPGLISEAAAVTSGGRAPEEVRDIVSRVGHGKFDLVIMNPPFTRPTNHEASHSDVPIPSYAAFETTPAQQAAMSETVRELTRGAPSNDNAGLASHFVELAHRKLRKDGTMAFVLPLSSLSGASWEAIRTEWRRNFSEMVIVTIAGAGTYDASFSANTGMAECLLVARSAHSEGKQQGEKRATFVILNSFPSSTNEAELLATQILEVAGTLSLGSAGSQTQRSLIRLGASTYGILWNSRLPESGPWPLVGLTDTEVAAAATALSNGQLIQVGQPNSQTLEIPIVPIAEIASRGPVHRDIDEDAYDGTPRGPFARIQPIVSSEPTYPMLWSHAAKRERTLVVQPDAEGEIKQEMDARAAQIWATATRVHYNCELRFNSQSLITAMTDLPTIGGTAWPSVIFGNSDHEYAFALWCNSTLGLLMHWWSSNKTQSGRGRTTVTGIPNISALDTRALTPVQHAAAKSAFEAMRELRFLPFDQIDEDPARCELDRRLLVDVLGLPEAFCVKNGPLDLLRRKLAREPQIHGGKKSRIVFDFALDRRGGTVVTERRESRDDR